MAEYYGVTRTPEYLMHSGVKGMKWGIRKAKPTGMGKAHSAAYMNAQKKLSRIATAGGVAGGIAGGLAKGFAGGAIGGAAGAIAGGLGYYATHRKQLKAGYASNKNSKKVSNQSLKNKRINSKDRKALNSLKGSTRRGAFGGGLGAAVGALSYAKKNPKEYARAKKAFKKMSFRERMKYAYS